MEARDRTQHTQELFELIAGITDPQEIRLLFEDLCTRKEVENMAERVFAARLLLEAIPTIRSWPRRTFPLPP